MRHVPDWWQFALLSAAAFRVFRLLSEDTILDRPRAWLLGYTGWQEGQKLPDSYRTKWGEFVTCRWCLGFHCSIAFWVAWLIWPHATTVVAVPLAVSTALAFVSGVLED